MSKYHVLFDSDSTELESKAFAILPGYVGIISAYGMTENKQHIEDGEFSNTCQELIVQKLGFKTGPFPDGSACAGDMDSLFTTKPEKTFIEDVYTPCLWTITACDNVRAISIPGTYRVRLNDSGALGSVTVILMILTQEEAGYIPGSIYLGA